MRKFNFRLEKVRDTYTLREQQSQRNFAEAAQQRDQEQQHLDEINSEIENLEAEQYSVVQSNFCIGDALIASKFHNKLVQTKTAQNRRVETCEQIVDNRRGELTKAMQRRQIMDNLREKKLAEHKIATGRQEQKELDDLVARSRTKPR